MEIAAAVGSTGLFAHKTFAGLQQPTEAATIAASLLRKRRAAGNLRQG